MGRGSTESSKPCICPFPTARITGERSIDRPPSPLGILIIHLFFLAALLKVFPSNEAWIREGGSMLIVGRFPH